MRDPIINSFVSILLLENPEFGDDSFTPRECFPELWNGNNATEIKSGASAREKALCQLCGYCLYISNYTMCDLGASSYAYDEITIKKLIKIAAKHKAAAAVIKDVLVIMIRERLDLWNGDVGIGLDDNFNIVQFSRLQSNHY